MTLFVVEHFESSILVYHSIMHEVSTFHIIPQKIL